MQKDQVNGGKLFCPKPKGKETFQSSRWCKKYKQEPTEKCSRACVMLCGEQKLNYYTHHHSAQKEFVRRIKWKCFILYCNDTLGLLINRTLNFRWRPLVYNELPEV